MKTICLGPEGSFSEDALIEICHRLDVQNDNQFMVGSNAEIIPSLLKSDTAFVVSAMHTLAGGRVNDPFEGVVNLLDSNAEIAIPLALKMSVAFSLFARTGVKREGVVGVVAHDRAFTPCSKIIDTFPKFKSVSSNSLAARMVAEVDEFENWAALASSRCGMLYGLEALESDVSNVGAITTFYAFAKGVEFHQPESHDWRMLAIFDLLHEPRALLKVLQGIDQNILHLHSVHQMDGKYRFVMEVETRDKATAEKCADVIHDCTQKAVIYTFPVVSM